MGEYRGETHAVGLDTWGTKGCTVRVMDRATAVEPYAVVMIPA